MKIGRLPAVAGFLALLLLGSGCAHKSRVILLDSGRPTAVVIDTDTGRLVLNRPNTGAEIKADASRPAAIHEVEAGEIEDRYGPLLESQPRVPAGFMLYFKPDSLQLVEKSWKTIPEIAQSVQERKPCDVSIYGYTDRAGSRAYNNRLSQRRARKVYRLLKRAGVELENVEILFYGEEVPLVPTPDGVAEPRNRRVEVQVR